jgi:hypothetical protein
VSVGLHLLVTMSKYFGCGMKLLHVRRRVRPKNLAVRVAVMFELVES